MFVRFPFSPGSGTPHTRQAGFLPWLVVILLFPSIAFTALPRQSKYHQFGGTTLSVPNGYKVNECTQIRSQLFRKQNTSSIPVTQVTESTCEADIEVTLPDVNDALQHFDLVIEVNKGERWEHLDTIPITGFPRDMFKAFREWAKEHKLMVADSEGKLEAFLKEQEIPYTSAFGFEPPSPRAIMKVGKREYVFNEIETPFPKIWIKDNQVIFELRFLDQLSTNPLAQKELLQVLKQDMN
ncbi:hypothetical protein [Nitrospina gracilis]|uniref:hypothetical protein n=1 Tax=Nitrospina gracilis TaxID=35801 RepID=UPI001F2BACA7|nr:hypothetical protein [Nitrospina gracilis]MCF8720925.1 hypothetical protein [Nitrospina gracilis Nb-211]